MYNDLKSKIGTFYRNHKGKILVTAGVIGVVVISGLLRKDNLEEQENVVEERQSKQDYELVWIQSNDSNKSYTIDLPVSNDSDIESDLKGLVDDINNGNWHRADL